jgi:hypothetical protein
LRPGRAKTESAREFLEAVESLAIRTGSAYSASRAASFERRRLDQTAYLQVTGSLEASTGSLEALEDACPAPSVAGMNPEPSCCSALEASSVLVASQLAVEALQWASLETLGTMAKLLSGLAVEQDACLDRLEPDTVDVETAVRMSLGSCRVLVELPDYLTKQLAVVRLQCFVFFEIQSGDFQHLWIGWNQH